MNYHEKSKKIADAIMKRLVYKGEKNFLKHLENEQAYKDVVNALQQVIFNELVKK